MEMYEFVSILSIERRTAIAREYNSIKSHNRTSERLRAETAFVRNN